MFQSCVIITEVVPGLCLPHVFHQLQGHLSGEARASGPLDSQVSHHDLLGLSLWDVFNH